MPAARKWRFTYGYGTTGTLLQDATDFWVEYKASGEPAQLSITLHACWQYAKSIAYPDTDGLVIRSRVENRLRELALVVGRQGILDIDYDQGNGRPVSLPDIVLDAVTPTVADHNKLFEYDITFKYPVAGQLVRVLNLTEFNTQELQTLEYAGVYSPTDYYYKDDVVFYNNLLWRAKQQNKGQTPAVNAIWSLIQLSSNLSKILFFTVLYNRQDRTQFKPAWKAPDIRIRSYKGLQTISIQGIRQNKTGTSDLNRRINTEQLIRGWSDKIGSEFLLSIDSEALGVAHLQSITPGKLDLPDACVFDLTFVRGYVNG